MIFMGEFNNEIGLNSDILDRPFSLWDQSDVRSIDASQTNFLVVESFH